MNKKCCVNYLTFWLLGIGCFRVYTACAFKMDEETKVRLEEQDLESHTKKVKKRSQVLKGQGKNPSKIYTISKKSESQNPTSLQKKKKIYIKDEDPALNTLEHEGVQPKQDASPEDQIALQPKDEDVDNQDTDDRKNTQKFLPRPTQLTLSLGDIDDSKALEQVNVASASTTSWLLKKVKDFSKIFSDASEKWIPDFAKNFAHNISYRYLENKNDQVMRSAIALFKNYEDTAQKTVSDVKNVLDTGGDFSVSAGLGGLESLETPQAPTTRFYTINSDNPVLLMMNATKDLQSLDTMGKTILYGFEISQSVLVNILADLGRGLFTEEKVLRNLFESPEKYKSIVDKYMFEKYFKSLMHTLIGIYGVYHLSSLYYGTSSESYIQSFQNLSQVIKDVGAQMPKIFPELFEAKGWFNKAHAVYKILFNNAFTLEKFQRGISTLQVALLEAVHKMLALGSKHWSKKGYESVKLFETWLRTVLSQKS